MNTATPAPAKALNQGVAPVTYGVGDRPPRGDYASAASDYTCAQRWEQYTPEQHALVLVNHGRASGAQLLSPNRVIGDLAGEASGRIS